MDGGTAEEAASGLRMNRGSTGQPFRSACPATTRHSIVQIFGEI